MATQTFPRLPEDPPVCPLSILGPDLDGQSPAFTPRPAVTHHTKAVKTELLLSFVGIICPSCTQAGGGLSSGVFHLTTACFASVPQKTEIMQ